MSAEEQSPVPIGTVIDGKYRVEKILGAGGIGLVVRATHLGFGDSVALKFLQPAVSRHPEMVARFLQEGRAARCIQGEHVAKVQDVGTLPSGEPFLVMEFLSGCDLSQLIEREGKLSIDRAVGYLLEACEAVAQAHAVGIVHRDLKPANLFLAESPGARATVKVLDFGISKMTGPGGVNITQTQSALGSPLYMSPEQVRSAKHVDARADVWALGVILYELVTGRAPFLGPTVAAVYAAIIADSPTPLREALPTAPAALEVLINSCLEKDPSRRFQSVAELAHALVPFVSSRAAFSSIDRISHILPPAASGNVFQAASPVMAKTGGNDAASSFAPVSSTYPDARVSRAGEGAAPLPLPAEQTRAPSSNFAAGVKSWAGEPRAGLTDYQVPTGKVRWAPIAVVATLLAGATGAFLFHGSSPSSSLAPTSASAPLEGVASTLPASASASSSSASTSPPASPSANHASDTPPAVTASPATTPPTRTGKKHDGGSAAAPKTPAGTPATSPSPKPPPSTAPLPTGLM
jgi:serine/threonine protein kinase